MGMAVFRVTPIDVIVRCFNRDGVIIEEDRGLWGTVGPVNDLASLGRCLSGCRPFPRGTVRVTLDVAI